MQNKKIIIILISLIFIIALVLTVVSKNKMSVNNNNDNIPKTENKLVKPEAPVNRSGKKNVKIDSVKTNLYSESPYYMPFSSMTEISKISPELKQKVNEIFENSQGFYFLKQNHHNKSITILLQNPIMAEENKYSRHNLQEVFVDENGSTQYHSIGYDGEADEIDNAISNKNDLWEFDKTAEPYKPLKHVSYDKKKKVLFTETWNYDDSNPVKYEMTDATGNVVSIMKETVNNDSNYIQEHIFYDSEGKTIKSMSVNYDGADIKWFTYYDAEVPDESVTIENIYENGLKTEEKIYNKEFQPVETIKADYDNGTRTKLKVFDSNDKETLNFENED